MRQRRIALADAIIDKYDMLTPEQVRLVRDEYVKFL